MTRSTTAFLYGTKYQRVFILLTGRNATSGTKTNLPTTLLKYKELNFCEINYLTQDLYDSESLESDYNHSAVKIIKI